MSDQLTGRVRVRGGWFGKIVLQVETVDADVKPNPITRATKWRDATVSDLSELHNLTYAHIAVTVRLPDIPLPMSEPELPGAQPIRKPH